MDARSGSPATRTSPATAATRSRAGTAAAPASSAEPTPSARSTRHCSSCAAAAASRWRSAPTSRAAGSTVTRAQSAPTRPTQIGPLRARGSDRGPCARRLAVRRAPSPPRPPPARPPAESPVQIGRRRRSSLRALSAMSEDAIGEDAAERIVHGRAPEARRSPHPQAAASGADLELRADARVRRRRPCRGPRRNPAPARLRNRGRYDKEPRFYSRRDYQALLLTPALTGLRLGELLALRHSDYKPEQARLTSRCSAHQGRLVGSSDQKNHERAVPVPPSLAVLLDALPPAEDPDAPLSDPRGRTWHEPTSTARSGSRRRSPPASIRPRTSSATPTSVTCAPPASTTPTSPRSPATVSRR